MNVSLARGSLHHRHRLSGRRQDHADPPCARQCAAAGGSPSSSTSSAMSASTAKFSKAAATLPARRTISSSLPTAACAARLPTSSCRRSMPSWRARASNTSLSKPRAWRCPSRWCRRSTGRRSRTASPSTASWWWSMAQRSPTAAWRRISRRSPRNAQPTPRSLMTIRSKRCSRIRSPAPTLSCSTSAISSARPASPRRRPRLPRRCRAASR